MSTQTTEENNSLRLTANDLIGKQSVRATFRLPQQVIDLLTVISGQLGIKQKSLFDQLIENASVLGQVAEKAQNYAGEKNEVRQKTFVISRNSLLSLNDIAKRQQIPRDLLVEISIKRLLPVIETELEKHKKRKALLSDMQEYLRHGKRLQKKTGAILGKDDFVYEMIKGQVNLAQKNVSSLSSIVAKGMPMEDW
nr:hypothetical protein [Desulfobulbaceae bacterium]